MLLGEQADFIYNRVCIIFVVAMHQDAEFFAAKTSDQIGLAEIGSEDIRNGFEDKIAGSMSPGIIYLFKKNRYPAWR